MPLSLRVGLAAFITLFPIICVCNGLGEPKYWGPERLRWVIWCVVGLWALGAAWGLGAFLALVPQAALIIGFAAVPSLALGLLLGDLPAILAFAGPVTFLSAAAIILRTGNMTAAAILLLLQAACGLFLLRSRRHAGTT